MKPLKDYKLFIGPMSKNVVDACIDYANIHDVPLAFIPSRRQIEWNGGYSNNWTTKSFAEYVNASSQGNIIIVRDHAGPGQGNESDDGRLSLGYDRIYFDLIHLDPWKTAHTFEEGCNQTRLLLNYCCHINPKMMFEVGTEESIFKYEPQQLDNLLGYLRGHSPWAFDQIKYAVIQGGTSLEGNTNTGKLDWNRLDAMLDVCKKWNVLSKEHNGDYLPVDLVRRKLRFGLDAINIAPEFGQIETQTYLDEIDRIGDQNLFDTFHQICYDSGRWKKWFANTPNRLELVNACGHYVLSQPNFWAEIKSKLRPDIDDVIKANITEKLNQLYGATT
jgi:hypothetical protein